MPPKKQPPQ
jgi:ElaB/YqjD/DUF883 family membrane-anchored ribosome-binding protein